MSNRRYNTRLVSNCKGTLCGCGSRGLMRSSIKQGFRFLSSGVLSKVDASTFVRISRSVTDQSFMDHNFQVIRMYNQQIRSYLFLVGTIHNHPASNKVVQHTLDMVKPDITAIEQPSDMASFLSHTRIRDHLQRQGSSFTASEFYAAAAHPRRGKLIGIDVSHIAMHIRVSLSGPIESMMWSHRA